MSELEHDIESAFSVEAASIDRTTDGTTIQYICSKPLRDLGFIAAFSTRAGGVSTFVPGGLSLGYSKADSHQNVDENRRRFLAAIGAQDWNLVTASQTHSVDRCTVRAEEAKATYKCDALMTREGGLLLGIQTADCLPILIADPKTGAMAAIHAGWRGTAGRITERAIADLMSAFGVNPRTCIAALGPAACSECYEVGPDVIDVYKRQFGYWKKLLRGHKDTTKAYLDIRAANVQQMGFCGITIDRVHVAPFCTIHDNRLFFSHRKESDMGTRPVGKLLSVIGRPPRKLH